MIRRRVLITGRVQGVFFRQATAAEARARGLNGWVRNLADGNVEAVFEGSAPAVEALVAWCGTGPPGARVTGASIVEEPVASEVGFRIR